MNQPSEASPPVKAKLYTLRPEDRGSGCADFIFWCPACNCGHGIWTTVPNGTTGAVWQFNGDMERPSFTPSLLITRHLWDPPVTPENQEEWNRNPWPQKEVKHICHLFLTDGKIHYCSDSTHEMAGKVVDLVAF